MIVRLLIGFIFLSKIGIGQEVIDSNYDINLPIDSINHTISFSSTMNEETFTSRELKSVFKAKFFDFFDSTKYFLVQESDTNLEYFVTFPITNYSNDSKFNGIIVFSIQLLFFDANYSIAIDHIQWITEAKATKDIYPLYDSYLRSPKKAY